MKISLRDKIVAKVYGANWMVNYLKGNIRQSKDYIRQENELLHDTKKLGHLPKGVTQRDIKFAKDDKKYLKRVIADDQRQLKKWQSLKKVI